MELKKMSASSPVICVTLCVVRLIVPISNVKREQCRLDARPGERDIPRYMTAVPSIDIIAVLLPPCLYPIQGKR